MADNNIETIRRDYLFKEIDLIQSIITRMGSNSFAIKKWTIALVAVAILFKNQGEINAKVAILPLMVFWGIDAYFLDIERKYRKLYDWVINNRMKTDDYLLSLDFSRFNNLSSTFFSAMFSKTLLLFYGIMFFLIILFK